MAFASFARHPSGISRFSSLCSLHGRWCKMTNKHDTHTVTTMRSASKTPKPSHQIALRVGDRAVPCRTVLADKHRSAEARTERCRGASKLPWAPSLGVEGPEFRRNYFIRRLKLEASGRQLTYGIRCTNIYSTPRTRQSTSNKNTTPKFTQTSPPTTTTKKTSVAASAARAVLLVSRGKRGMGLAGPNGPDEPAAGHDNGLAFGNQVCKLGRFGV